MMVTAFGSLNTMGSEMNGQRLFTAGIITMAIVCTALMVFAIFAFSVHA